MANPSKETRTIMKPTTLIEDDVFWEDEEGKRANAIAAAKYFDVFEVKHFINAEKQPLAEFDFYRGSFGLRSTIYKHNLKTRESLDLFNCLQWVPPLKQFYLNKDYAFLDADSLSIGKKDAFPCYLRPCKGNKVFSGQEFKNWSTWFTEFCFFTKNLNHSPYEICLIATPKKIGCEWRTIFVDNKYVGGAMYLDNGERIDHEITHSVIEYAKQIARHEYFLNLPNFVIDICASEGKLYLLEINSIYTSSFYTADLDSIYAALADYLK